MEKANVFGGVLPSSKQPLNYLRHFYKIMKLFFSNYAINAISTAVITDLQLYNKIKNFKTFGLDKCIALYIRETSLKSEDQIIQLSIPIHRIFIQTESDDSK